ncbi:MAG: alkaline phosphatase family protein, partial [Candidatus Helarchaeota archaeon]
FYQIKIRHLPTSTGAGHATISTGTLPIKHGILGLEWYDKEKNLKNTVITKGRNFCEIKQKFESSNLTLSESIAKKFYEENYKIKCIAGKDLPILILGHGIDEKCIKNCCDIPMLDQCVFDEINDFINNDFKIDDHIAIICSLSATDIIGHKFGPQSIQIRDHLKFLDKEICTIFLNKKLNDTLKIVTSDHGAVKTDYVARIQEVEGNYIFILYNTKTGKIWKKIEFEDEDIVKNNIIEEGICYLNSKNTKNTKEKIKNMLGQYVQVEVVNISELDHIKNSNHDSIGDLILLPKKINSKSKFRFVKEKYGSKIKGEHGSISNEEIKIPLIQITNNKEGLQKIEYQDQILDTLINYFVLNQNNKK